MKNDIPLEFGFANGGILVTPANSPYTPAATNVVYHVVPNPNWVGKAIAKNAAHKSMSSDRTQTGTDVTVPIMVPFSGRYSSVSVSSGSCIVYEKGA